MLDTEATRAVCSLNDILTTLDHESPDIMPGGCHTNATNETTAVDVSKVQGIDDSAPKREGYADIDDWVEVVPQGVNFMALHRKFTNAPFERVAIERTKQG